MAVTKRARKRAKKHFRKTARLIPRPGAPKPRRSEDTALSKPELERVRFRVRKMAESGTLDVTVIDARWWECKRCGFDPRADGRPVAETVYDWWRGLNWGERRAVLDLSRECGKPMKEKQLSNAMMVHAVRVW